MIPSTWYPLKYSTHAATKTPVVERISEKESALYALNASDFKFTFTNSSLTSKTSCSSLANYTLDSSTNKYKATTKRTISTGNSTIPLWVDLGSYFDVPTTHIGGITVTYKNSVTFSYASPSDTPIPKAK